MENSIIPLFFISFLKDSLNGILFIFHFNLIFGSHTDTDAGISINIDDRDRNREPDKETEAEKQKQRDRDRDITLLRNSDLLFW